MKDGPRELREEIRSTTIELVPSEAIPCCSAIYQRQVTLHPRRYTYSSARFFSLFAVEKQSRRVFIEHKKSESSNHVVVTKAGSDALRMRRAHKYDVLPPTFLELSKKRLYSAVKTTTRTRSPGRRQADMSSSSTHRHAQSERQAHSQKRQTERDRKRILFRKIDRVGKSDEEANGTAFGGRNGGGGA